MKLRNLSLAPYPYRVYLISTEKEWAHFRSNVSTGSCEFPGYAGGWAFGCDGYTAIVVNPGGELHEYVDVLAHESTHAFQHLCSHINEPNPSKEFEAYTVGMIAGWIMEKTTGQFLAGPT